MYRRSHSRLVGLAVPVVRCVSLVAVSAFADSVHAHFSLCLTSVALVLLRRVVCAANSASWEIAATAFHVAKLLALLALGGGWSAVKFFCPDTDAEKVEPVADCIFCISLRLKGNANRSCQLGSPVLFVG